MQNMQLIDNQRIRYTVVEMWYTKLVKKFHYAVQICHSRCFRDVFGKLPMQKKQGSEAGWICHFLGIIHLGSKVWKLSEFRNGNYRFSGQKKRIIAASCEPVCS